MRSTRDPVVPHLFPAIEESAPLPLLEGAAADAVLGLATLCERLKQSTVHGEDLDAAAARLVALVDHPDLGTRVLLAGLTRYLRHEAVYGLMRALAKDPSSDVRAVANESLIARRYRALEELWDAEGIAIDERAAGSTQDARSCVISASLALSGLHQRILHHELRGAMTPLFASLGVLRDGLRESPLLRHAERALERAQFIFDLSKSLVDVSAPSVTPMTTVALAQVVHDAAEMVRDAAGELADRFEVRIDVPNGLVIEGRRADLLVACRNVLQNGLEASSRGCPILLRVEGRELNAELASLIFVDHGVGMPAEVKRDAFTLFSTIKVGGSGIGLPFVRKVVEFEHDGVVRLDDNEHGGTNVTFILPKRYRGDAQ